MKGNSIEIRLLGQKIPLKTSGDSETTQEVVELVAELLDKVEKRSKTLASHQVALLALLELAEEYIQAKKRLTEFQKKIHVKSGELFHKIETELKVRAP